LAALVGVLLLLARVLRLGFVANFISAPVLVGFKAGIGIVILLDQVPKLFGLHITKSTFLHDVAALLHTLPETSLPTLAVGLVSGGVLIGLEILRPHSPVPLAVVAAEIAASAKFHLGGLGVSTVGHIPQGLPSLTLPDLQFVQDLLPGALGIALMSFTETIAAGRASVARGDPPL
jgi:sulfate permease, SulP family